MIKSLRPESKNHKGRILKDARIARGLSLEMVHEATKIPLDPLRAIEEGYEIRTLSKFYYNGFIKIYAHYLNIDVASVLDDSPQEKQKDAASSTTTPVAVTYSPVVKKEAASGFVNVRQWVKKNWTKERRSQLGVILGILVALFVIVKLGGCMIHKVSSHKANSAAVLKVSSPFTSALKGHPAQRQRVEVKQIAKKIFPKVVVAKESSPLVAPKTESAPMVAVNNAPRPATSKSVTLMAHFKKRTWLRVKVDGQVVFQSTMDAGSVETWKANDKIEISGNDISQTEFDLNGKFIGLLGSKNRQASEVVVTKDGLNVIK